MFIKTDDLLGFLNKAVQNKLDGITDVFLPITRGNGRMFFAGLPTNFPVSLDSYRTVDPVKILFYLARQRLTAPKFGAAIRLIVGVKACDLKSLELLDRALINMDFIDAAYQHWRLNSVIVSTDCSAAGETCHCNLLGGKPFAETGFDLNLSPVGDNTLLTIGSEKGQWLVDVMQQHVQLAKAPEDARRQVRQNRAAVQEQLARQNAEFLRPDHLPNLRELPLDVWEKESATCVGCGACTNICPTCYCLILNDETEAQNFVKERSYDSCQWSGYARVAGGGTPRPKISKRFRNRYLCKFDYMQHNFGESGCTGCGRCIEACTGKIDFRAVVANVSKNLAVAV